MKFTQEQLDRINSINDEKKKSLLRVLNKTALEIPNPAIWDESVTFLLGKIKEPSKSKDFLVGCIMLDENDKIIDFVEQSEVA